jgi:outer membrane usher protein
MPRTIPSLVFTVILIGSAAFGQTKKASAPSPNRQIVFLAVSLNGKDQGVVPFIREGNSLFLSEEYFKAWRFAQTGAEVREFNDQRFLSLSAISGLRVIIDEARQSVSLEAPAALFSPSIIEANAGTRIRLSPSTFSAFLNYELNAEQLNSTTSLNSFAQTGISDRWGVLTNSVTSEITTAPSQENDRMVRLDTSFVHDGLEGLTRLILGDGITRGSEWARPIRFGGVQFGTNFGLRPNFITFPTPEFSGQAALPSTVQAYVNNAIRYSGNVPQGPFDIRQIPVVTGAGEVRFVTTDILGVQRSVTTPYYVSSRILREGLEDFSFETGLVRQDYGINSFSYGNPLAMGTYRRGLTDALTIELHGEANQDDQVAGAGLVWVAPFVGEFGAHLAASRSPSGDGYLGQASYTRLGQWWSISLSYQAATTNFTQIGTELAIERIVTQAQAFGSVSLGRYGSLSASYTELEMGDRTGSRVASLNYDLPLADVAYLNAFVLLDRTTGMGGTSTTFGFQLTLPLGERDSASVSLSDSDGRLDPRAEFRRDPPFGTGVGYRASLAPAQYNRADGQIVWRNDISTLTGEVADTKGGVATRLQANGSLAYAGGKFFAARELGDAYGVADVSGYPGIRVYQENQLLGRTDSSGRLAIPALRPYQENAIRIEAADLPFDTQISHDAQVVVPSLNGGVVADFPIQKSQTALVTLVGPDNLELQPGISLTVDGHPDAAFTGRGGQVFITNARDGMILGAEWHSKPCIARVGTIPRDQAQPRVGPVVCQPTGE